MYFYDKKICYLNLYQNGAQMRGAGYAKFEAVDEECYLTFILKGMERLGNIEVSVSLLNNEGEKREVGKIRISGGQGSACFKGNIYQYMTTGLAYDEIFGIQIDISDHWKILSKWDRNKPLPQKEISITKDSPKIDAEPIMEPIRMQEIVQEPGPEIIPEVQQEPGPVIIPESQQEPEPVIIPEQQQERGSVVIPEQQQREQRMNPSQQQPGQRMNSAQQLEREMLSEPQQESGPEMISETQQESEPRNLIYPFTSEEPFMQVTPAELSSLTEDAKALQNNSFLLHGYYNYHYIILSERREPAQERWIGVPGIYHDREKMVAGMFGFQDFRGRNEKIMPGEFGYYMRRLSD